METILTHFKDETVAIAWCDSGLTDARFTDGILNAVISSKDIGINIRQKIRVTGNQIGRQRQVVFDEWANSIKTDWLLWVDSDIVLTKDVLKTVWDAADKLVHPVVTGTYFITSQNEMPLMQPLPALFFETGEHNSLEAVHPLPENQLIQVDCAGFGLVLMHKSIIPKMLEVDPGYSLFAEQEYPGAKFVSEDVVFFRKLKKAGIPLFAHTGAIVQHMKRFSFDQYYYNLYWKMWQLENGENDE